MKISDAGQNTKTKSFKSRREWEDFVWTKILKNIERARSRKEIENILDNILSKYEKKMMIKRAATISLIEKGLPYRRIGEILWISPSTISSIKNNKSAPSYRSRREFDKARNGQKAPKATIPNNLIEKLFNFPLPPPRTGKGRWKFLNYQR